MESTGHVPWLRGHTKEKLAKEETAEGTGHLEGKEVASGNLVNSRPTSLLPCWDTNAFLGADGGPGISVSVRERTKGTG